MARSRIFVEARATHEPISLIASGAITHAAEIGDFYDDPAHFRRSSNDEIILARNGDGAHRVLERDLPPAFPSKPHRQH